MNKGIAHVLMQKIKDLPYIQRFAGLVSVQEEANVTGDGLDFPERSTLKKYPVTNDCCITKTERRMPGLVDMTPNSSYFGQVYFEDKGLDSLGRANRLYKFKSKIRMVVWLNSKMIVTAQGFNRVPDYAISTAVYAAIQDRFNTLENKSSGYYHRLKIKAISIPIQDKNIFLPYTFNLEATQYLMAPYEFFAVDYEIEFQITSKCIDEMTVSADNIGCGCSDEIVEPVQYPALNNLMPYLVTLRVGIDTNTGPIIIPDSDILRLQDVEILSPIVIDNAIYHNVPLALDGTAWDFTDSANNVYEGVISVLVRRKIV